MVGLQEVYTILGIVVLTITILSAIFAAVYRWIIKPFIIKLIGDNIKGLKEKVSENTTTLDMDMGCDYRILDALREHTHLPGVKIDFYTLGMLYTDKIHKVRKTVTKEESAIRLLPLGIRIIEQLGTLGAYLDKNLGDVARRINQEIIESKESKGSNAGLLSKLYLMTDKLIFEHTTKEEMRSASGILRQEGYIGNPFPVFTSAVLVYILTQCVERGMLEEKILNLAAEADEELSAFRNLIGLGG